MSDVINPQLKFDDIYQVFYPKIQRYLTRLVGNQDAEDLTQEVFIKVGQALETFRSESQLSTWIYRIATNAAIDRKRSHDYKNQSATITHQDSEGDLNISKITDRSNCSLPETELISTEMNSCIRAFIDELPEIYRTVIILSEFEGFKNKEIAEVLGLSLDVVKIRLHRAKEKLKDDFSRNCHFYRNDKNVLACEPKGTLFFKKKS